MPDADRRQQPDRREESIAVKLAHLEELVRGVSDNVAAVKESSGQAVKILDQRVSLIEVNVRALEDWRLAQKVLENERKAVADEDADARQEQDRGRITHRQFWTGIVVTSVVTILAALLASHTLF